MDVNDDHQTEVINQSHVQDIISLIQEKFDINENLDEKLVQHENSDLNNQSYNNYEEANDRKVEENEESNSQKSSRDTGFEEMSSNQQENYSSTNSNNNNNGNNDNLSSSLSQVENNSNEQEDYIESVHQSSSDEQQNSASSQHSPNLDEEYRNDKNYNKEPLERNSDSDEDENAETDYFLEASENQTNNDINTLDKLNEFIDKAIQFGANALDLSRKGLKKLPKKLFELENLQYIYLEGNHLTELPRKFFLKFPKLKWLDLRNNFIKELPTDGLNNHEFLRYLLLENNKIKRLPNQIANLRYLTALNLIDNPIEYPPLEIVQKGCKAVQDYLKNEIKRNKNYLVSSSNEDYENVYNNLRIFNDDVWASDEDDSNENNHEEKYSLSSATNKLYRMNTMINSLYNNNESSYNNFKESVDARIKSATKNFLVARPLRPSEGEVQNSELKERLNKAKINANRISKSAARLLEKRKSLPPVPSDAALFKNKDLEKAIQTGKVENYKKNKERIDAKLQKVNDKIIADDFKNELRAQQRKLMNKRLVKGVDYMEPVMNAPFDISEEHLMVMTNEEREMLDRKLANERMRPISPDTLWKIEEERRVRDNELQEKIREYTQKLLINRTHKSSNPKLDRIQAAKDIRELRKLEKELNQRRSELQHNYKSTTGSQLIYRETAKLNARATIHNVLKNNKTYD